jgi:cytochrome P450
MIWSPARSHKVPEFFPDPEKFDPSRFEGAGPLPYTYLAFGSGPHTCPRMEYAKMEMLLYLHYVVTRFQWSLLYPNEPITIDPSPVPKWGLPLKISPRTRSLSSVD